MILALTLALSCPHAATAAPFQTPKRSPIRERFAELFAKRDRAGCVALWKQNPGAALPTIDRDLEGSLKIVETKPDADPVEVGMMRERAQWGARCAAEALGHPLIADYAASFVGWSPPQQKLFREEQAIFRKAMGEIGKGEFKAGLESGLEVVQRAVRLGDWWGAAMGHEACAAAHEGLSETEDALAAWSLAWVIDRDLGLGENERKCLLGIAAACEGAGRPARGREACEAGLAIARRGGDKQAQGEWLGRRATFEEGLGDKAAAERTRKEAEGLNTPK